jgi:hypothetical protein
MSTDDTNKPHSPKPALTRWQVAVHEAAHAAYAHLENATVTRVTVEGIVAVENGAKSEYVMSLGRCHHNWGGESEGVHTGRLECALCLVGPAATHKAGWPENLLLPYEKFLEHHPNSDAGCVLAILDLAKDPRALYEKAREEAGAFVEEHYSEIVALAKRLMEKETIGASEVSAVLGPLGPSWYDVREMLDEMAREDDLTPEIKRAMEEFGVDDPDRIGTDADGGPILLDW